MYTDSDITHRDISAILKELQIYWGGDVETLRHAAGEELRCSD